MAEQSDSGEYDPEVLTEFEEGGMEKRIVQGASPVARRNLEDPREARDYVWIESKGMHGRWHIEQRLGPVTEEYNTGKE